MMNTFMYSDQGTCTFSQNYSKCNCIAKPLRFDADTLQQCGDMTSVEENWHNCGDSDIDRYSMTIQRLYSFQIHPGR